MNDYKKIDLFYYFMYYINIKIRYFNHIIYILYCEYFKINTNFVNRRV